MSVGKRERQGVNAQNTMEKEEANRKIHATSGEERSGGVVSPTKERGNLWGKRKAETVKRNKTTKTSWSGKSLKKTRPEKAKTVVVSQVR